ncbi:MAG TPA: S9 family peptidase, partial [Methanotrichaceae archaeon]|nr:S9 family peptidase [Methanotrichaceae archaeon]
MTLIQENREFSSFDIDEDYNVRFATNTTPDGGAEIFKRTGDDGWEIFSKIPMEDMITTGSVGFNKTGEILYMVDSRGRNTAALFAMNTTTGVETLIAEDPKADFGGWMRHPTEMNVQAVAFTYERKHWQVLDDSVADDLAYLQTVDDGDVEVLSRSLDDKTWIVVYVVDDG